MIIFIYLAQGQKFICVTVFPITLMACEIHFIAIIIAMKFRIIVGDWYGVLFVHELWNYIRVHVYL